MVCRNYDESQDEELQEVFNLMTDRGINLWDTADSYGMRTLRTLLFHTSLCWFVPLSLIALLQLYIGLLKVEQHKTYREALKQA